MPTDTPIENSKATATASNYEVCQRTGFRLEAGRLIREWTGHFVRPLSWESRHPLELERTTPRETPPGLSNPEPADRYLEDRYPDGVSQTDL